MCSVLGNRRSQRTCIVFVGSRIATDRPINATEVPYLQHKLLDLLINYKLFKGITKAPELPELQESSENIIDEFLDTNEKGKTYMRDMMKPVSDACRDDGTLKEANEMVWPDSPTALEAPQDNFREYDEIYVGFQDETDSIDLPNIKVNSVLCF